MRRPLVRAAAGLLTALVLGGCFDVAAPDLFVLTRTGAGAKLTVIVNDDGTIRCNGSAAKPLSDPLLLAARDIATSLDNDAKAKLRLARTPNAVYTYTITLQDGTLSFPDTAAAEHHELAPAELFAAQVAQGPCASR